MNGDGGFDGQENSRAGKARWGETKEASAKRFDVERGHNIQ
jgi:hypothetical protein